MTAILTEKWTIEDYHRMIEAGILVDRKVELLRGEIVSVPPEGELHASGSTDARRYLERLLIDQALVRDAKPITLPNDSEPEPDLAIVEPISQIYRSHHPYPENIFWLIEYSNATLTKDLEVKSKIYAEAGIREYWVVNLKKFLLVVFRDPQDGDYASKMTIASGTIQPLAFPAISVDVDRIING
jgi:Uma2 family endonuclease